METSRPACAQVLRYDGAPGAVEVPVEVPVEVAINIVYGSLPHAVMMASPCDLEDFAVGFSLTEGIVVAAAEIRGIRILPEALGIVLEVELAGAALRRHMARRRGMAGRTGCGICGIESLDQLPAARPVGAAPAIAPAAIGRALRLLDERQPLHRATGGVHGAAWCDADGEVVLVREDVGRHNALDKLIGACLRAGRPAQEGFLVITSRCSFEMVEKAAAFGAATLVAISAPTSLALERAESLGVTVVAVARHDGALRFIPQAVVA